MPEQVEETSAEVQEEELIAAGLLEQLDDTQEQQHMQDPDQVRNRSTTLFYVADDVIVGSGQSTSRTCQGESIFIYVQNNIR